MIRFIHQHLPPLIAGIAVAKTAGFAAGAVVFFLLPLFVVELDPLKRWALLFWYPTVAGVAAASNVADLSKLKIVRWRWWQRSALIGAWLNLIVVLFASGTMQNLSMTVHLSFGVLTSQFWFVADGAIIGLMAGYVAKTAQQRAVEYRR